MSKLHVFDVLVIQFTFIKSRLMSINLTSPRNVYLSGQMTGKCMTWLTATVMWRAVTTWRHVLVWKVIQLHTHSNTDCNIWNDTAVILKSHNFSQKTGRWRPFTMNKVPMCLD